MKFIAPFRDYIDTLVHPSAQRDALTAARHRAFIGSRILSGLIAIAAFPLYLLVKGLPSTLEAIFFAWLLFPLANAFYLARTGRYETAQIIASLALTGLVTLIAAETGGISSFVTCWLVVVPLEAALSASRRAVAVAAAFAASGAVLLALMGSAAGWPPGPAAGPDITTLGVFGIVSAVLYATAVGLRSESLARTSSRLLSVEEERYHLLARNMTDVITRHGGKGAVLFVSPAAEMLFGVSGHELMEDGLFERVHLADRPGYLTALAVAAVQAQSQSVEFRVRRDAGVSDPRPPQYVWIEMRCRAMSRHAGSKDDDPREVVAVMREVTERKVQEHALEEARHEAERSNAAKSRFLAVMSHELRTPLNAIIGFSEMLMNEDSLNLDAPHRHDYAHLINDSGNHLLSVVNGILDMSKIETGNFKITPEPFAPVPIIASCCDLLTLKARGAGIELVKRIGPLPEIVADKRALKQILFNLVSNAIKFTDRGGRVTVAASVNGSMMELTIEDTGVGISETDLQRLGDPFFQARASYARPYDGTGLGLSIVKGLVVLHGGKVDIKSRLGEGTHVTVSLPIDCEALSRRQEASRIKSLPVVEDVPDSSNQQVKESA